MTKTVGRIGRLAGAAAVAAALAACGVKSSPQHPEGTEYPRTYPAGEPTVVKEAKPDGEQVSPQGFPLEYPNRAPTR